ncbi:hypothetical protein SBV1_1070009 [Verrucomicrobia bacterium]|nr:hypothetical protein SBV1_1070009 [Verrucomicrobiota bacterium]
MFRWSRCSRRTSTENQSAAIAFASIRQWAYGEITAKWRCGRGLEWRQSAGILFQIGVYK